MNLLKITLLMVFGLPLWINAQNLSDHTAGLRLGDSDGLGAALSYQKSISRENRIELNLSWQDSRAFDIFKLAGVYQWVMPFEGNFNWYYGFGGGLGNVDFEPRPSNNNPSGIEEIDGGLFIFGAANLGLEYHFDFPLVLSLDMRPELGLLGYSGFSDSFDFDIGLGIRYKF